MGPRPGLAWPLPACLLHLCLPHGWLTHKMAHFPLQNCFQSSTECREGEHKCALLVNPSGVHWRAAISILQGWPGERRWAKLLWNKRPVPPLQGFQLGLQSPPGMRSCEEALRAHMCVCVGSVQPQQPFLSLETGFCIVRAGLR